MAATGHGDALSSECAGDCVTAGRPGGHDNQAHSESSQLVDDDRLVASHHPLLVHHSAERERRRIRAWIFDALAHGDKVLIKHRFAARAPQPTLTEPTGAVIAARQSGQLHIIDAQQCYTDTGGDPQALFDWHLDQLRQT